MTDADDLSTEQLDTLRKLAGGPCETTTASFLHSVRGRAHEATGARLIIGTSAVALAKRRLARQVISSWDRTVYEITPTGRAFLRRLEEPPRPQHG